MAWDLLLWVFSFFVNLALLASTFYQLICLTDLEADFMNPFETSSRVNGLIIPEFILQGVLSGLYLVTWHWFMFLFAVPLTCYHAMLYKKQKHLIDVTEVFRNLNFEKKLRFIKLGFYLILFVVVIFRFTVSVFNALSDEEDAVHLF
ncbi:protein cornichon homolog 1 isoform X2 [Carica papaya]|uniref:protein cornichon homolog 1 isoform X2 n=1 Tax=Carica papaya TaxID=3649 RepID=UPI000B8D0301|nr:protein cornichon homolog 1 isoform X2 [Carica papaya]